MARISLLILALTFSWHLNGQEKLYYHTIRTDDKGMILPWADSDPGIAYDKIIRLVWNFWDTMRMDPNNLPYYMNHQVWQEGINDPRGLGGDQLQMALSSWRLLYAYTGNEKIKQNMKFIADYYLGHSLSPPGCRWPNMPFPYNLLVYSGYYDGDMIIGKGYFQPDKAGSLGLELVNLYKLTIKDFFIESTSERYLQDAILIAETLLKHLKAGDEGNSPLPFKVNAFTGKTGQLIDGSGKDARITLSSYTTNWTGTMELFLELEKLDPSRSDAYRKGFDLLLDWMKKYPLQTNRWGPFFEDVQGWSDTQINAMTFARFIMEHRDYFPDWQKSVESILDWVYRTLGNNDWNNYGVIVINEQTSYQVPGQSHTARQGADELLYCYLTGDTSRKANALRQLNWATYTVADDGRNAFPNGEIWLTDGYGDYIRHYLRAMSVYPEVSPSDEDHLLSSESVVQNITYRKGGEGEAKLIYRTFDTSGTEIIRLSYKPGKVILNNKQLEFSEGDDIEGYSWEPMQKGGILKVFRENGNEVSVF